MGIGECVSCLAAGYHENGVAFMAGIGLCQICAVAAWNAYVAGGTPTPQTAAANAAKTGPHPRS